MRIIIAVPTCWQYFYPPNDQAAHYNRVDSLRANAIRETWYRDCEGKIDVKFFFGRGAERAPQEDEIFLDCGDDYYSLPEKVQKMFEWCISQKYDYAVKLDDDVFCYVDRLLGDFQNTTDYRGYEVECASGKYASGTAYWISYPAMRIVSETPWHPADWAEDKFVGRTLYKNGINLVHDERYHCCRCEHCLKQVPESQRITSHTNKPHEMHELYKENHG